MNIYAKCVKIPNTVKPAQAATSIKRAPPLNGHLNPPSEWFPMQMHLY